jgi:general secretion pathway protein K
MALGNRRGIALLAVLGALVLLSVIAAAFLTETRSQTKLARNAVENAKARALADAGVHRAVLALSVPLSESELSPETEELLTRRPELESFLRPAPEDDIGRETSPHEGGEEGEGDAMPVIEAETGLKPDGTVYAWTFGGSEVLISVQDEAGRIDLNAAPDELIKGLLIAVGVDEFEAARLTDAVADFRDEDDLRHPSGAEDDDYHAAGYEWGAKDAPFELVAELRQVMGMTAELFEAAAPALTVYSERAEVDRAIAPPLVLAALTGGDADAAAAEEAGLEPLGPEEAEERRGRGYTGRLDAPGAVRPRRGRVETPFAAPASTGTAFTVRAEAETPSGAVFVREAVVGLTRQADRPFTVLAWRRGQPQAPVPEQPE